MERNQKIIRASVIGITANVFLSVFKAIVGLASGSIAIIMDAVNNLSDVFSSVITIVGVKLSMRPADREHPFGHGRIEYFSAIVISMVVLGAGFFSFIESIGKVLHPTPPSYTTVTLIILIVAIIVKLLLGRYVKKVGLLLKSDALIASGVDALFDAVVTLGTLISVCIMLIWEVNLDGVFGVLISLVIIKTGIEMLSSPVNELLGSRISPELVSELKKEVMTFEGVYGVYDIIINKYGHHTMIGSLHINVSDSMNAREIHRLTREISLRVHEKFNIILTVGIYAVHTDDKRLGDLQQKVMSFVQHQDGVLQAHAFYYYDSKRLIAIDVVPEEGVKDHCAFCDMITAGLRKEFPGYDFDVLIDNNYSE